VLVLGSLPGRASIEAGQYYAQPQNAFWHIMGELCAARPELPYRERLGALKRAGVALWDVLHAAERPGSLDASIVSSTQQPNDIVALLRRHSSIRTICFNGKKAEEIFRRHLEPDLPRADIRLVGLPSTSPAHASLRRAQKLELWRKVLAPLLNTV
jgi:hypoxanthine-DNA glycosylase